MRKALFMLAAVALLMSSCGTYTGEGAIVGAQFGTILGSAVGGISGGWRGSDVGAIVGMAGGAVVGAAIGQAADQKEAEQFERRQQERRQWNQRRAEANRVPAERVPDDKVPTDRVDVDDSGFDATGGGDDRIDFDAPGPGGEVPSVSVRDLSKRPSIELLNVRIIENSQPGTLHAGEQCKVVFEIMNRSRHTIFDIQPMVNEMTGNKHLHISPNLNIESIAPGTGVRYTATVLADKRLKDGQAVLRIAVAHHQEELTALTQQFTLQTLRR